MKKSLFAIAAVTAFAGAAQAQSSVTVYGILDVGFTAGSLKNTTANGVGNTGTNVSRITSNNESGSRLGFRGNEDLGGGTSAQFVFELGTAPGTESVWAPNVRQAYIGLTQKGAGEARIGTQNSLYWEQGGNMTGQLAQVAGSMLNPSTVGAAFGTASSPAQAAYTVRTNNTITVRSAPMSGFQVKAAYTQNSESTQSSAANAAGGFTGGVNDQSGYQVAAAYIAGKANLQASYAGFTSQNPFGAVTQTASCVAGAAACVPLAGTPAGGVAGWTTAAGGTNAKDNQMLVTASYDFGILKAYAGYTDRRIQSTTNSNDTMTRTGYEIGVRSFITSKVEGWASGGLGRYNPQGVGGNTANLTAYQVGSNYWLSKRTNLYAIAGANNVAGTTASGTNAATAKQEIFQYAFGVRHTF